MKRLSYSARLARRNAGVCMNGCDAPISPPSKVVCRGCLDKMGTQLEALLLRMEQRVEERRRKT